MLGEYIEKVRACRKKGTVKTNIETEKVMSSTSPTPTLPDFNDVSILNLDPKH